MHKDSLFCHRHKDEQTDREAGGGTGYSLKLLGDLDFEGGKMAFLQCPPILTKGLPK
jgi:hypothetical protein